MDYIISGIQQVGIGVRNVDEAWAWYRRHFGMDVPVFREAADAPLMTRYTGDVVHARDAVLALNLQGGGGMEIWQFTSREPEAPDFEVGLGDLGLLATRLHTRDVAAACARMRSDGADVAGEPEVDPAGTPHFFVRDPGGLLFDVVESGVSYSKGQHATNGPGGCLIGVSDIDGALPLYRDLLGYDRVEYDETGVFADFDGVPGGGQRVRRMLLGHSRPRVGPFSEMFGPTRLELVSAPDAAPRKVFKDRFWGDLGFIHLCFDVRHMDALKSAFEEAGYPFTVDSENSFDMGEAAGRFSYIEDPDGTLIEFVETHKMPILKKLGWYLDLRKRPAEKPLPRFMLKALGLGRVRD